MDQNQPPVTNQAGTPQPTTPPVTPPPAEAPLPYKTGDGSYNRESGKKTLAFVGVMIALIAILSISSLLMISKKSSVMIQSETDRQTIQPAATSMPSIEPTSPSESSEEAELDSIDIENSDADLQGIEQDANQL